MSKPDTKIFLIGYLANKYAPSAFPDEDWQNIYRDDHSGDVTRGWAIKAVLGMSRKNFPEDSVDQKIYDHVIEFARAVKNNVIPFPRAHMDKNAANISKMIEQQGEVLDNIENHERIDRLVEDRKDDYPMMQVSETVCPYCGDKNPPLSFPVGTKSVKLRCRLGKPYRMILDSEGKVVEIKKDDTVYDPLPEELAPMPDPPMFPEWVITDVVCPHCGKRRPAFKVNRGISKFKMDCRCGGSYWVILDKNGRAIKVTKLPKLDK